VTAGTRPKRRSLATWIGGHEGRWSIGGMRTFFCVAGVSWCGCFPVPLYGGGGVGVWCWTGGGTCCLVLSRGDGAFPKRVKCKQSSSFTKKQLPLLLHRYNHATATITPPDPLILPDSCQFPVLPNEVGSTNNYSITATIDVVQDAHKRQRTTTRSRHVQPRDGPAQRCRPGRRHR
jgi:hypothetical protein